MTSPSSVESSGSSDLCYVESANEESSSGTGGEGTSLESTTSAESASVLSFLTQIDISVQKGSSSDGNTQRAKVTLKDAKSVLGTEIDEDPSRPSSALIQQGGTTTSAEFSGPKASTSTTTTTTTTSTESSTNEQEVDQERSDDEVDGEFYVDKDDISYGEEDDTTLSSEAVVDDIELILMPEMAQDLPAMDLSPQLVRVTELKRSVADFDSDVFRDDDGNNEDSDQESDFKKMGSEDEDDYKRVAFSGMKKWDGDDKNVLHGGENNNLVTVEDETRLPRKVNSGVQTDITALESSSSYSIPADFRRKPSGKSSNSRLLGIPGKRLNWKSELTLLPSKTKIATRGGFIGYEPSNEQDQYSPRVAKFTSQDALSSSHQFLRPSTLYRTRNLSRNLNQCESSESTLVLPMTGMAADSPRYRDRMSSSHSTTNFKDSHAEYTYSAYQSNFPAARRQPFVSSTSLTKNFRSSLPDLSPSNKSSCDNKGRRQTPRSMKHQSSTSSTGGYKLHKKSSSDDETSSLIDESERCLRSSIDLLLTDDLPSPGGGSSYRLTSTGLGPRSTFGYYSSRRTRSQPILTDDIDSGDLRDSGMGSPFLPRKLSDMRLSRHAKVILPSGHVAVVLVKETDELRDTLTVHSETGCILTIPFRKVVFAWKIRR